MCGHGVIALAAVAVATGMVPATTPETRIGLDTPAGFVEAFVEWDGQQTGRTRFRNVPSFLYHRDMAITTPSFGALAVDVAFGGAFYAYLAAAQAGLTVRPTHYQALIQLGDEVKHAVEAAISVVHPLEPELHGIYGTIIDGPPQAPGADQANVCVFADREVDRSPTGTGTAGRVAQLYARGLLAKCGRSLFGNILAFCTWKIFTVFSLDPSWHSCPIWVRCPYPTSSLGYTGHKERITPPKTESALLRCCRTGCYYRYRLARYRGLQ